MRIVVMMALFTILAAPWPSISQEQLGLSFMGGIGLTNVNTPENPGGGKKILGLFVRYSQYGANDPRGEISEYLMTGAYGVNDHLDVSILLPLVSVQTGNLSFGEIHLSAKYNNINKARLSSSAISNLQIPVQKAEQYVRTK